MFLNKGKLHEAISVDIASSNFYARAAKLRCDVQKLTPFQIGTIGQVSVPVKTKDLNSILLLEKLEENPAVIDKKHFCSPINEELCKILTHSVGRAAIIDTFGVDIANLSINVEAVPEKLVILSGEETYYGNYTIEKMPGHFGTIILQIPTEGVTGGTSVTAYHGSESKSFGFDVGSDENIFMAILSAKQLAGVKQGYTIKAVHKNPCLVLLLNLVCSDSVLLCEGESHLLAEVIQSANKVHIALNGWKLLADQTKLKYLSSQSATLNGTTCSLHEAAGNSTHAAEENRSQLLVDASKVNTLCLPLSRDYCKDQLNFNSLIGEDAVVARILGAIDFINVELAIIADSSHQHLDWKEAAVKPMDTALTIVRRIPKERSLAVDPHLIFDRSLVGNLKAKISCPIMGTATCTACSLRDPPPADRPASSLHYIAFLISLKGFDVNNNQKTFLTYHLKELNNQLPKALDQKSRGNYRLFIRIRNEVMQIIDAVSRMKEQSHSREDCPFLEMIKPLIQSCQHLQVTEPFQKLLHLLFHESSVCVHVYENPMSPVSTASGKTVNSMLAESIVILKGWNAWSTYFMGLIAGEGFPQLLDILCDLGAEFYNLNLITGAMELGNALVKQFADTIERNQLLISSKSVATLMSFICTLEAEEATSAASARLRALIQAFNVYSISCVVTILEIFWLKNSESKQFVFLYHAGLTESIENKIFEKLPAPVFDTLIRIYESVNDVKSLSTIWTKVCWACVKVSETREPKCTLLSIVLTMKTNEERDTLLQALEKYARNAKIAVDALQTIVSKRFTNKPSTSSSLVAAFMFFSLAQEYESLANDGRISSIISSVLKGKVSSIKNFCSNFRSRYLSSLKTKAKAEEPYRILMGSLIKQRLLDILSDQYKLLNTVFLSIFRLEDVNMLNYLLLGIVEAGKSKRIQMDTVDVPWIISEVGQRLKSMRIPDGSSLQTEHLTDLVELWFGSLLDKQLDAFTSSTIVKFVSFLIVQENYLVSMESILEELHFLIPQLHPDALIDLIFALYELPILKSTKATADRSSNCRKALVLSCKGFILNSSFRGKLEKLSESQIVSLMEVVLWIGEEMLVSSLTKDICSIPSESISTALVLHQNVRELASKSLPGVEAFNVLIDHSLKCMNLPNPNQPWSLPDALIPQNKKLEKFLKSNLKRQTFGTGFTYKHHVVIAGQQLVSAHANLGFEVKQLETTKLFVCELYKLAPFTLGIGSGTVESLNAMRLEKPIDGVIKTEKISRPFDEIKSTQTASDDDEVQVLPPEPKKPKIDPVLIVLD